MVLCVSFIHFWVDCGRREEGETPRLEAALSIGDEGAAGNIREAGRVCKKETLDTPGTPGTPIIGLHTYMLW